MSDYPHPLNFDSKGKRIIHESEANPQAPAPSVEIVDGWIIERCTIPPHGDWCTMHSKPAGHKERISQAPALCVCPNPEMVDTMSGPGPEYCLDCWGHLPQAPAPSDTPPLWITCDEDGIPVYLVKQPIYDALAARIAALEAERDALKAERNTLKVDRDAYRAALIARGIPLP
jgi:hypothetical protein